MVADAGQMESSGGIAITGAAQSEKMRGNLAGPSTSHRDDQGRYRQIVPLLL